MNQIRYVDGEGLDVSGGSNDRTFIKVRARGPKKSSFTVWISYYNYDDYSKSKCCYFTVNTEDNEDLANKTPLPEYTLNVDTGAVTGG